MSAAKTVAPRKTGPLGGGAGTEAKRRAAVILEGLAGVDSVLFPQSATDAREVLARS